VRGAQVHMSVVVRDACNGDLPTIEHPRLHSRHDCAPAPAPAAPVGDLTTVCDVRELL
jgi:hypothetical protein